MTSQGVIAIHADWPLYQLDHGVMAARESFGSYPVEARFRLIDDIDRCALFVREPAAEGRDAFDPQNSWHAAAWHVDLLDAADAGYQSGVERRPSASSRSVAATPSVRPSERSATPATAIRSITSSSRSLAR